jgi:DNA topoisomerase IA
MEMDQVGTLRELAMTTKELCDALRHTHPSRTMCKEAANLIERLMADTSTGLIEAAEIAQSLKRDAYLYTATDAGREGFMMACYRIAETLRARAV